MNFYLNIFVLVSPGKDFSLSFVRLERYEKDHTSRRRKAGANMAKAKSIRRDFYKCSATCHPPKHIPTGQYVYPVEAPHEGTSKDS